MKNFMKNFKMDYIKSYLLMWICFAAGILMTIVFLAVNIMWLGYVGMAVILAGVLQTLFFCRCPACGKMLNIRGGLPHYCSECGEFLQ